MKMVVSKLKKNFRHSQEATMLKTTYTNYKIHAAEQEIE